MCGPPQRVNGLMLPDVGRCTVNEKQIRFARLQKTLEARGAGAMRQVTAGLPVFVCCYLAIPSSLNHFRKVSLQTPESYADVIRHQIFIARHALYHS